MADEIPMKEVNETFLDSVKGLDKAFVGFTGLAGIAGFNFDIERETEIELRSQITDHFLEDNTVVNDNIGLLPPRITLSGDVGEIRDIINQQQSKLEKITERLTTLVSYLPDIANTAQTLLDNSGNILSFNGITNAAEDLYQLYKNINIPDSRQQEVFLFFEAMHNARTLFTVDTCYRTYTDMAIESIKFRQSEENRDISRIVVVLKKFRFTQAKNSYNLPSATGRLVAQVSDVVQKGLASVSNVFV